MHSRGVTHAIPFSLAPELPKRLTVWKPETHKALRALEANQAPKQTDVKNYRMHPGSFCSGVLDG